MAPPRGPVTRRGAVHSHAQAGLPASSVACLKWSVVATIATVLGPLFLIFLTLRCEKNQCVLFQLPLIVPVHAGAYFSGIAWFIVLMFLGISFLVVYIFKQPNPFPGRGKSNMHNTTTGLTTLVMMGVLMLVMSYLRPEYIEFAYRHYLHILVAMTCVSLVLVVGVMAAVAFKMLPKKDFDRTGMVAFFWGTHTKVSIAQVELKSFLYINVGLVAWGLLDLLIFLNFLIHTGLTGPVAFLTLSQLLVLGHALLYETYFSEKPFKETEGLGFLWLLRVMLYLPFINSLLLLNASVTEITLSRPVLLSDTVLFFFGFIVYLSAIHQKKSFNADPTVFKNLQSIPASPGKRLLIGGYWSVVQKPDYLGYIIMLLSWAFACGLSGVSLIVMFITLTSILMWQNQLDHYNHSKLGNGWLRYTSAVPKKLIPYIY